MCGGGEGGLRMNGRNRRPPQVSGETRYNSVTSSKTGRRKPESGMNEDSKEVMSGAEKARMK